MDLWEPNPQRHKRSYRDMSHPATLSPSPIHFGDPATSSFYSGSRYNAAASENPPPYFERRRTSHPHNHHSQRASEEMSDFSQSQLRPRLEHRTSQTVIDLTDEAEDAPPTLRNSAAALRSQRPPQLGRSDAINLGDFIDLTEEGDIELMITGERQLPVPRLPRSGLRVPIPGLRRADSPPLFMPAVPLPAQRQHIRVQAAHAGAQARQQALGAMFGPGVDFRGAAALVHAQFPAMNMMGPGLDFMHQIQQQGGYQAMPGQLNYGPAWQNQKPDHVPPPAARDGFTRSPTEDNIVICPSCETELVHDKDTEEPVTKRGGKAPSRKDREEHPFWVVKECGHVYCNSCFQLRSDAKKHSQIAFQDYNISAKKKGLMCAVDDCISDVKGKDKWVGVFL